MERKIYYLYLIRDLLNEKVYIGQTVRPKERWSQHKAYANNNPVQYIHRAMAKYGIDNFIFDIIATCRTLEDADETEILLIQQYDSRNKEKGYNIATGGDHAWNTGLPAEQQPMYGKTHSEESRQKISESNMGKIIPPHTDEWKQNMSQIMTGRISPMLGKKQSEFFKQRMSEVHSGNTYCLGKTLSDETKQKISIANIGKKLSEETKEKLSIAHTGKVISEESRQKMSESKSGENHPNFGKNLSQDTKNKISNSHIGKIHGPMSQETKDKISAIAKGHSVSHETRNKIAIANSIKFSPEQIIEIQKSELTLEKLAKIYGVGKSTIWRIKNKRR